MYTVHVGTCTLYMYLHRYMYTESASEDPEIQWKGEEGGRNGEGEREGKETREEKNNKGEVEEGKRRMKERGYKETSPDERVGAEVQDSERFTELEVLGDIFNS